jgi:hypothetical protein
MKATIVAGAIALVAVFTGVYWLARDPAPADPAESMAGERQPPGSAGEGATSLPSPQPATPRPPVRPTPPDPRLAALMGSPDHPLVEYQPGPDGRIIKEIDRDPNSQGYSKPLREYLYADGKLIGVTAYKYLGNQVQVIRAAVTYKPDGAIDEYRETTEYRKP